MRRLTIIIIITALTAIAGSIIAQQDEPTAECDPHLIELIIKGLRTTADAMEDAVEKDASPLTSLIGIQTRINYTAADCMGLSFSSEANGMRPVLGPVPILKGLYRVTATTPGYMTVKVEALSGECAGRGFGALFNMFEGNGTEGAQQVFESSGCQALITIENTTEEWTLIFEKLQ